MKVSVIIPNYNHCRYLKQRIDSVVDQTFENFEVIILDDCSTDDSLKVIEAYHDHPKVSHIVINEQNSGSPFLQWKKGIQLAKGEWIWVAESDDWCEPNFLEELVSKLRDDVVLAFCQSIVVNQDGKKIWQTKWPKEVEVVPGRVFVKEFVSKNNHIVNASMCIFRKKYFEQVSFDFFNYKFIGDWVLWHRMAVLGKVVISGKHLNYFRKHEADVSGRSFRSGLNYTEYLRFLESLHDESILSAKDRNDTLVIRLYEFLNDKKIDKQYRRDINSLFHSKLGFKYYLLKSKNWVVKNFKRPLYELLGVGRTQFQYFVPE